MISGAGSNHSANCTTATSRSSMKCLIGIWNQYLAVQANQYLTYTLSHMEDKRSKVALKEPEVSYLVSAINTTLSRITIVGPLDSHHWRINKAICPQCNGRVLVSLSVIRTRLLRLIIVLPSACHQINITR